MKYGKITGCRFGRGGGWRQDVYKIESSGIVFGPKTIRAVSEGPYWQTAKFTIPPRADGGDVHIAIRAKLIGNGFKRLDIDNIAITEGELC